MGPDVVHLAGRLALMVSLCTGQVHHAAGAPRAAVPAQELHHPQVGRALGHLCWFGTRGRVTASTAPALRVQERGRGSGGVSDGLQGRCGATYGCCPLWGAGGVGSQGSETSCPGELAWSL